MKHIKLFEQFDKYNFIKNGEGEGITNLNALDALVSEIDEISEPFNQEDDITILEVFNDLNKRYIKHEKSYVFFSFVSEIIYYELYYTGDYCYSIVKSNEEGAISTMSIDGFDDFIKELKSIINTNIGY